MKQYSVLNLTLFCNVYTQFNLGSSDLPQSPMIISTKNGQTFDTDKDLSAPERHVLQKLFAWEAVAENLEQFRKKKAEALEKGWNNSGSVKISPAFRAITKEMERKVVARVRG